jgi:hypothetical protein
VERIALGKAPLTLDLPLTASAHAFSARHALSSTRRTATDRSRGGRARKERGRRRNNSPRPGAAAPTPDLPCDPRRPTPPRAFSLLGWGGRPPRRPPLPGRPPGLSAEAGRAPSGRSGHHPQVPTTPRPALRTTLCSCSSARTPPRTSLSHPSSARHSALAP